MRGVGFWQIELQPVLLIGVHLRALCKFVDLLSKLDEVNARNTTFRGNNLRVVPVTDTADPTSYRTAEMSVDATGAPTAQIERGRMPDFQTTIKVLSILGAVVAFMWGVYQFTATQRQQVESRKLEATKPYLERQLALYTEATKVAATIATSSEDKAKDEATSRFWALYWGELSLVEDAGVEAAMVNLGKAVPSKDQAAIQPLALKLAHACRNSLARSWGVAEWKSPYE